MLDYVLYIPAILTIRITQFSVLFFAISAQWCYGIILRAVKLQIKRCRWTDQLEYALSCKNLIRILFFAIGTAFSAGKLSPVATIMKRLSKKMEFWTTAAFTILVIKVTRKRRNPFKVTAEAPNETTKNRVTLYSSIFLFIPRTIEILSSIFQQPRL